jgi:DNA-binding transcriptional ArsR family regulator
MDAFAAIADPSRREILESLTPGPQSAGTIAARFAVSGPAISQHLKVLRVARLVQVRVDAQRRIYALDPGGFKEIEQWLLRYRTFWNNKIDALAVALQSDANVRPLAVSRHAAGSSKSETRPKRDKPRKTASP